MFLRLTVECGDVILFNMDSVMRVVEIAGGRTMLCMMDGDDAPLEVRETISQIVEMMNRPTLVPC